MDLSKIKPYTKLTDAKNSEWKAVKKVLCGDFLEKLKIRTMEIGRGNTGSGLTGNSTEKIEMCVHRPR